MADPVSFPDHVIHTCLGRKMCLIGSEMQVNLAVGVILVLYPPNTHLCLHAESTSTYMLMVGGLRYIHSSVTACLAKQIM